MPLTPVEILHKEFKRAFRGYGDTEVQEFLRDVARDQERVLAELARLKEEKQSLQQRLAQFERMEDTLQKTLVMAQTAAEDTRKNAQRRAEATLKDAENQRDAIIHAARERARDIELEAARVQSQADQFEAQFRAILRAHEELLNPSRRARPEQEDNLSPAVAFDEDATVATTVTRMPEPVAAPSSVRTTNGHDEDDLVEAAPLINWRGIPHD